MARLKVEQSFTLNGHTAIASRCLFVPTIRSSILLKHSLHFVSITLVKKSHCTHVGDGNRQEATVKEVNHRMHIHIKNYLSY